MDRDPAYGLAFAAGAFDRLGLAGRWAYYDGHSGSWLGPAAGLALDVCRSADVLLNVSCVNPLRAWMDHVPVRVLVDTDPVFTQIRHLSRPDAHAMAARHTAFFSFGENIGRPGCTIPPDGFPWQPTRQPIVMDAWTSSKGDRNGPLSTVMLWDSYPSAEYSRNTVRHEGRFVWSVRRSARPVPRHVRAGRGMSDGCAGAPHAARLDGDRSAWAHPGSLDLPGFIRRSKAEFSVAKHGYVVSQSGWFSERSAAYLASGRPVVVQDTGFSRWLCADGGVLPFANAGDQALEQLEALNGSYDWHCRQARLAAEEHFNSADVLTRLLDAALDVSARRPER